MLIAKMGIVLARRQAKKALAEQKEGLVITKLLSHAQTEGDAT